MISIVMATYNGESFIQDQLSSINNQIRKPDRLIICDDGSGDNTRAIIDDFQFDSSISVERIFRTQNLGFRDNFLEGCSHVTHGMIAFSDQDDIWHADKLAIIEKTVSDGIDAVCHSYLNMRDKKISADQGSQFNSAVMDGFQVYPLLVQQGMSLAVDKKVVSTAHDIIRNWAAILPSIGKERSLSGHDDIHIWHDLATFAAARFTGRVAFIGKPLAKRRLHDHNVTRPSEGWDKSSGVFISARDALATDYGLKESFLRDFADKLITEIDLPSEDRRSRLIATYHRWAEIWRRRQMLLAPGGMATKLSLIAQNATNGAYASRLRAGLGVRSFLKDALVCTGVDQFVRR
jgi:glycosyltransferase involved in cell wall biosynthesis